LHGKLGECIEIPVRKAEIKYDRLALDITELMNRLAKGDQVNRSFIGGRRKDTYSR